MPTPNGVNYLLSFLQYLSIPQLSEDKNPKVDVHPICLYMSSQSIGTSIYLFNNMVV